MVSALNDIYSELWDPGGIWPSLRSEKVLEVNGLKSTDESNLSWGRGGMDDDGQMDGRWIEGWINGWMTDVRGWFFSHPDLSHSCPGRPAGKLLNLTVWREEDLFLTIHPLGISLKAEHLFYWSTHLCPYPLLWTLPLVLGEGKCKRKKKSESSVNHAEMWCSSLNLQRWEIIHADFIHLLTQGVTVCNWRGFGRLSAINFCTGS